MCSGKPCLTTVCGLPLRQVVLHIGLLELLLTLAATTLNVIKYTQYDQLFGEDCASKDVCVGPLIKYTVFDAAAGVLCSVLLIAGSLEASRCLLLTWCLLSLLVATKHAWVVLTHDWTSLEDWISISFLLFISLVFTIVWSRILQINQELAGDQVTPGRGAETTNKVSSWYYGVLRQTLLSGTTEADSEPEL